MQISTNHLTFQVTLVEKIFLLALNEWPKNFIDIMFFQYQSRKNYHNIAQETNS